MREIKFRGKNVKTGEWVYGAYVQKSNYIVTYLNKSELLESEIASVDPESVGQYTGRKDTNGKEIFEGDIVTLIREWGNDEYSDVGVIKFHNLAWHIDIDPENTEPLYASKVYVIGNIHDNPEMLK